jgi:Large ribosomal RNA subunit accumulation protein YceD
MSERKIDNQAPAPWQVPVAIEDVAETGQHFDLVADNDVRAAVARLAGLRDLPRLEANFDVMRHGTAGLHVAGRMSATLGQNCVVTLEPLVSEVEEDIDLLFAPPPPPSPVERKAGEDEAVEEASERPQRSWNGPELLIGGVVDLGALATEFLILGLDPYPRKPDAVFEALQEVKPDRGPFAALAGLKEKHGR